MWTIKEDIATYKSDDFSMIGKIKIVRENGLADVKPEIIYMDKIDDPSLPARAMRELGEKMGEIGLDKFLKYTYRHCHYCGELFQLNNAKALYCSGKCRTAAHRLQDRIKNGNFVDFMEEHFVFDGGEIFVNIDKKAYDIVKYKDTEAKIFYFSQNDPDDKEERVLYESLDKNDIFEDVQYDEKGSGRVVIFDKNGDINYYQIMMIYDYFWKYETDGIFSVD